MPRGDNFRNRTFQQTMHDRMVAKYSDEQRREWSAKGWEATVKKYGFEFVRTVVYEKARQHRIAHPSKPEQNMTEILNSMDVSHERERQVIAADGRVTLFAMDFYLVDTHQAIEVDSGVHKINPARSERQWADKRKHLESMRVPVLIVEDKEMQTPAGAEAVKQKIHTFIQEGQRTLHERTQEPQQHTQQRKAPDHGFRL